MNFRVTIMHRYASLLVQNVFHFLQVSQSRKSTSGNRVVMKVALAWAGIPTRFRSSEMKKGATSYDEESAKERSIRKEA